MEFTQFINLIRRGWAIVLVATLIGVAAGFALTVTTKRSYAATATLFVAAQNSGATTDLQQGNAFALSRVKSYADVVTTDLVLTPVTRSLDLKLSREQLVQLITATVVPDTVIVTIEVTSSDPQQAAEIANALGTSLISAAQRIEAPVVQTPVKGTVPKADLSPVKITVVNRASVPTSPANPQTLLKIALGLLVGLALGLIIALIRGSLDNRVRGEDDLPLSDARPLLATIGVQSSPTAGAAAEAYRKLRSTLEVRSIGSTRTSVLVVSSQPGEGATTTAINLARAVAAGGQSVLLIDANLRRPAIARVLGLSNDEGLTSILTKGTDVDDVIQSSDPDGLSVITAGPPVADPGDLLGSAEMASLVTNLEKSYSVVIIDGAPLLAVEDSPALARATGGVVLVVGSGRVTRASVDSALSTLDLVSAPVRGIALTRVPSRLRESASRISYS